VEIPDVVAILGKSKATALLQSLILGSKLSLANDAGEGTASLARQIALTNVAKLKYPQWELAYSPDAGMLYEALQKRFPKAPFKPGGNPYAQQPREMAGIYYLLGLIVRGKTEQATALVVKSNGQMMA